MSMSVMTLGGQHQITLQYLANELAVLRLLQQQMAQQNAQLQNKLTALQAANNNLLAEANEKDQKTHAAYKIEIIRDPGEYDGSIPKYQEWWTNICVWLQLNDHLLVNDEEQTITLWSQVRGDRASKFAKAHIAKCLENK